MREGGRRVVNVMLVGGESVNMEGKSAHFKLSYACRGIIDRQHTASSRQHMASLRLFESILKIRSWCMYSVSCLILWCIHVCVIGCCFVCSPVTQPRVKILCPTVGLR